MTGQLLVALPLAFLAGFISFASPCVLPVIPGYVGMLGSVSTADDSKAVSGKDASDQSAAGAGMAAGTGTKTRTKAPARSRVALGATLFVLGFSVIYVLTGAIFGQLGVWFMQYQGPIMRVLGVLVIIMGLVFVGMAGPWQRTVKFNKAPAGLIGAPILGAIFGLGWAPCIGPTLVAIQALSFDTASPGRGALLAFVYCLGLGIPFILAAVFWNAATNWVGWLKRNIRTINLIGGGIIILIGLLMVLGIWQQFVSYIAAMLPGYVAPI
ncbi:cytochrome C biogenesis protein CcdA [Gulosibacter molinativorax]|uniref:Cytochrome C biogenesis protein CcdA n=2 Tax=Gulosibacter molinativorax TaxID=256821 RepID=A0ABT7CAU5_9MICO|nr:cytochrome C biogenesis protein CcdA [Gulosibacter molinativorax]